MKKFLSMALALAMTLSLCVFVASPKADADFEDADELSSQYAVQAADVIQKIEVMDGYDDGTFRPAAGLTRQAAAKIICNMILGPTTAKALPTNANPFPDVLAGNQFSGYVSYCAQQGIISGYGDGTFRPGDPLSGYAYLKMLLGALGYDSKHEGFVGDNWKVNVAKIALGIGLNKGIEEDLDGTTQVTRESAAIYAFNTLQADMVEYESRSTITINGIEVVTGGSNATPQTWSTSATQANNISGATDDGSLNGRPIVQFAERYFDKLEREPNGMWYNAAGVLVDRTNGRDEYTQDDFGRPSIKWFWKGVEIGTYSRDPDATFVGNVKVNAIYDALGMTSGNGSANLYINSSIPNKTNLKVERGNDKDLDHANNLDMDRVGQRDDRTRADYNANNGNSTGNDAVLNGLAHRVDRIGDGTLIECFRNEANNHVDVCVISVYGGKVNAVKGATSKKDAYVTIDYASNDDPKHRPESINVVLGANEYETEDFDENDVVAYTYSDSAQSIKSMYLMTSESGALNSRVNGKSLTLDDVKYSYGKEYTFNEMKESDLSGKSSYVVYLDDNDCVLWIEEDEFAVSQYVLIERITIEDTNGVQKSSTLGGTAPTNVEARVRTSSGAFKTLSLDDSKNYRNAAGTNIAPAFMAGRIVRISSNSNGYRLHSVDNKYLTTINGFALKNKKLYMGDLATIATIDPNVAGASTLLSDSETTFVVEDTANGTYKYYTGIKNVPNIQVDNNGAYVAGATAYVYRRNNLAKLIFITSATNVSSASNDIIFLAAKSTSNEVESDDGNYYDVSAVVKGEVETVRIKSGTSFTANGVTFTPGDGDTQKQWTCVILNDVTYDSNDLITFGRFKGTDPIAQRVHGIRRVNSEEVRLDTWGNNSYLRDVAENVRVYFVDGDEIEQIDYEDIVNDTQDYAYYVEDDGLITYLFIVDYEPDNNAAPVVVPTATVNPALAGAVTAGYAVTTVSAGTVQAGDSFTFQIQDTATTNFLTTADGKAVTVSYVQDSDGASVGITANETVIGSQTWTVTIPAGADLRNGSNLTFTIA